MSNADLLDVRRRMDGGNRSLFLRELIIIALFFSVLCILSSFLNIFEAITASAKRDEGWNYDYLLAVVLLLMMAVFSFLRGKKLGAELEKRKALLSIDCKQTDGVLRENPNKYRELAEVIPQTIYEFDLEGRLTFVSSSFFSRTGYDESDLQKGIGILDLVDKEDRERARTNFMMRLAGEEIGHEEYKGLRKDSTTFPLVVYSKLILKEGRPVGGIGIAIDATEQKKVEAEKRALQEQLSVTRQMQAMGTLAGGIAHDFNNILAAIVGYTELVLYDSSISALDRERLNKVLESSGRAKELVKQILQFSRGGEKKGRVPLDIVQLVKEVGAFLKSSIPSTIEVDLDLNRTRTIVLANAAELRQVLLNLCSNAAQAMEERGGVLRMSLADLVPNATRAKNLKPGPYVQIQVSDTGYGMDKQTMERIFDPYFTTKDVDKGSGLGLSVANGIVEQHEGRVEVFSKQGEGSTFNVILPVWVVPNHLTESSDQTEQKSMGEGQILVVDDEETLAEMTANMLMHLGYHTVAVSNAQKALEIFRKNQDKFDLVVTDFTMPFMTGEELAKAIMQIRPSVPIILTTGYNQKITEASAKKIGIRQLLMKPLRLHDLGQAVKREIDRGK